MKLILCTLALCLSILASVFAVKQAVREEGKKTRAAFSKATDALPLAGDDRSAAILSRLDALDTQVGNLNRHLSALEAAARPSPVTDAPLRKLQASADELRNELQSVSREIARLGGVPAHLAELTTFLDNSFDHMEKTVAAHATDQALAPAMEGLAQQLTIIDSYFTPLYLFLGLTYDPANQDLLAAYPSLDERMNELARQASQIRQEVADLNEWVRPPRRTEPSKPR